MTATGAADRLEALVDRAIDAYLESARFICAHVGGADAHVVFLCRRDPLVGIQCDPCMRLHLQRHDDQFENSCDLCGRDAVDLVSYASERDAHPFAVRTIAGTVGVLAGEIHVIGIGACSACIDSPPLGGT